MVNYLKISHYWKNLENSQVDEILIEKSKITNDVIKSNFKANLIIAISIK